MKDKISMRKSRVLSVLRAGGIVRCVKLNLSDSRVAEIASMSDFDCIWTDMEHVANDYSVIEKQILASKIYNTDTLVRVARGGYSDYIRPLELDASGIIVPHIMSLEDAKNVVRISKFHPIGRRPLDGGNADGAYCALPLDEYMRMANAERFLMIQIEDPEPLDELEGIIALEGIDIVFFGPGDFTQGIGAPGDFSHPMVEKTRKEIAALCKKHGKFAGTVASPSNLQSLIETGYSFISMGADVIGLGKYFADVMSDFGRHVIRSSNNVYGR